MNSFRKCCDIEELGMRRLEKFFRQNSKSGFVRTDKGRMSRELQLTTGDLLLNNNVGDLVAIEVKIEEENKHGNLFLEEWSNLTEVHFRRGWMEHLDAQKVDQLLYFFLDTGELFCVPFPKLKAWAYFPVPELLGNGFTRYPQSIEKYPLRLQGKNSQLNQTYGRAVPISTIKRNVGFKKYTVSESGDFSSADDTQDEPETAVQSNFDFVGAISR